jgi:hypothetical protein
MDAAERALLEATVVDAVTASEGTEAVDAALVGLGWLEMLEAEPRDAVAIVFDALGTTNGAATVIDDVVASALGMQPRTDRAVLLPPFGAWDAPGRTSDDGVQARGLATARIATARELLVVCRTDTGVGAVIVPSAAAEVSPIRGIDPDARFHRVDIAHEAGGGATHLDANAWESAVALGRRAVAQQIAGACRAMLALARVHAVERVQFGRPIARFQAVRHHLADALVAVEALDACLAAAGDEPNTLTAAAAKAVAGHTARTVAGQCQQVLAGIGFTTDHPFHRYLKRTMALDGVFGSADEVTVAIGRQLIAARHVPTLIEL